MKVKGANIGRYRKMKSTTTRRVMISCKKYKDLREMICLKSIKDQISHLVKVLITREVPVTQELFTIILAPPLGAM